MPKLTESVAVNRKFTGIASKYELYITHLCIDADAIRIEYVVTPSPYSSSSEQAGMPIISWWGYARDDHGGDYQDAGGAVSRFSNGEHIDGVLSLLPLPSEQVRRLDITMMLVLNGIGTDTTCEFSVILTNLVEAEGKSIQKSK